MQIACVNLKGGGKSKFINQFLLMEKNVSLIYYRIFWDIKKYKLTRRYVRGSSLFASQSWHNTDYWNFTPEVWGMSEAKKLCDISHRSHKALSNKSFFGMGKMLRRRRRCTDDTQRKNGPICIYNFLSFASDFEIFSLLSYKVLYGIDFLHESNSHWKFLERSKKSIVFLFYAAISISLVLIWILHAARYIF